MVANYNGKNYGPQIAVAVAVAPRPAVEEMVQYLLTVVYETYPAGGTCKERAEDLEGQLGILRVEASKLLAKIGIVAAVPPGL